MISKEYLGHRLLERGFRDWFLYMFRIIDGNDFVIEPVHEDMFDQLQNVLDGKDTRINENLCPRSAKTSLAKYFVGYTMTKNPRSHIIYTSFSQDLLMQIAQEIAAIMQNPIYKAMYPATSPTLAQEQLDPVDDFWKEYLYENTRETKFSTRKITTAYGGVVLFASIGSAITGFGAGRRDSKEFAGCLIIDDANKPADIRSETMRKKVHTYFVETLFTRLNSSDTPVINIQQRLHVEDLTGFLESTYGFKTFKHPLLDENGVCSLPSQYTPARVAELQKDAYTFSAQYQQSPVLEGGNLIKTEWFKRYNALPARFDSLFIVADTAFTEKKSADNSAFGLFGTVGKDLYMVDGYCKKVIFPDLCRDMVSFYESARARFNNVTLSAIYIENKGSGISLIQQLREKGLPVRELMPTVHNPELKKDQVTDKFTRFNEIAADLESGYVHIPESAPWMLEFISECEAFTGGKQDAHDDYCFVADTKIKCLFGDKNIQNIRVGDRVITPFGIRRVLAVKARQARVITNPELGLCGTPDHKVLSFADGLVSLQKAKKQDCMQWNIRNLHIWKTKKALCSTEQNTAGWGERENISYLMQQETQNANIPKGCTLRCGNTTTTKQCRRAMKFITKTAIHTTVALIIWAVYHTANTCKRIWNHGVNLTKDLSKSNICIKFNEWHRPGNAYIANCKAGKSTVYNLTVDGGLYFANNILVSNCDVLIYAMKVRRQYMDVDWVALNHNFMRYF